MWNAVSIHEALHHSKDYGFDVELKGFNWNTVKTKRDAYIGRLNVFISTTILFSLIEFKQIYLGDLQE